MSSFMSFVSSLLPKSAPRYVNYYHYVVGNVARTSNSFSDRLLIDAFEDVADPQSGLWLRKDSVPAELKIQCANALPFYLMAKRRQNVTATQIPN